MDGQNGDQNQQMPQTPPTTGDMGGGMTQPEPTPAEPTTTPEPTTGEEENGGEQGGEQTPGM